MILKTMRERYGIKKKVRKNVMNSRKYGSNINSELLISEEMFIENLLNYLEDLYHIYENSAQRKEALKKYTGFRLKFDDSKGNNTYYYKKAPGEDKYKYQGGEDDKLVIAIQELRYNDQLMETAKYDIALLETILDEFDSVSFSNIALKIPKTYRNKKAFESRSKEKAAREWKKWAEAEKAKYKPFRPEDLKHSTLDGNHVRSKSEASIYDHLLSLGYTFIYEMPVKTNKRVFFPDFAILSEIDYQTVIYIEHQGAMGDEFYREKAEVRESDYWESELLPNRDVFFTYDDCHEALDLRPIDAILKKHVRPESNIRDRIRKLLISINK